MPRSHVLLSDGPSETKVYGIRTPCSPATVCCSDKYVTLALVVPVVPGMQVLLNRYLAHTSIVRAAHEFVRDRTSLVLGIVAPPVVCGVTTGFT